MNIGARIRTERGKQGMAQGELVRRTGLQASYLSRVENGKVTPGLANLEKIARGLGTTMAKLLAPGKKRRAPR